MTQKRLGAKDKAGNRPRSERKRYINIIYFIDSKRTRTLKFSIKTGYLTMGTLCLLVGWSLIASLWLVREHGLNSELRSRSRNLLSVIFNYQTRYDQVYEKAYPNNGQPLLANPSASESTVSLTSTRLDPTDDEADGKVDMPTQPHLNPVPQTLAAKTLPPDPDPVTDNSVPAPKEKIIANALEKLPINEPTIAVENFSSATHDETLSVRFSLKNTNKGNKASGTVTAQARYFESGKEGVWLETQTGTTDNTLDTGDQDDPSSDRHFNIRYYKNKVFHFTSPPNSSGLFTAVKVTVKDEQGRSKEFAFPLIQEPQAQQTRLDSGASDAPGNSTQ